jgi:hypothetical protein
VVKGPAGSSFKEMPGFSPVHSTSPGKITVSAIAASALSAAQLARRGGARPCRCALRTSMPLTLKCHSNVTLRYDDSI